MTLHVDPIEAVWFCVTGIALVLTVMAFLEARRDLIVAEDDASPRHETREFTARSHVRRDGLYVVVMALLFVVVIPSLFSDRPLTLNPQLLALILVPIVLLVSLALDARDRRILSDMLLETVRADRAKLALESSVQHNIELTREATSQAKAAYHEANTVNEKIAHLTEALGHKEDKS